MRNSDCFCYAGEKKKKNTNKSPPFVDIEEIRTPQTSEFPLSCTFRKQYIEAQGSYLCHLYTYILNTLRKERENIRMPKPIIWNPQLVEIATHKDAELHKLK